MSIDLSIEQDNKLLHVYYHGKIDLEHLCKDDSSLVSLPQYDPTWDGISDFRNATILYSAQDMF